MPFSTKYGVPASGGRWERVRYRVAYSMVMRETSRWDGLVTLPPARRGAREAGARPVPGLSPARARLRAAGRTNLRAALENALGGNAARDRSARWGNAGNDQLKGTRNFFPIVRIQRKTGRETPGAGAHL
ncbi:hypothetical protein GCM10023334_088920 [Nonomuraea thailandensis]